MLTKNKLSQLLTGELNRTPADESVSPEQVEAFLSGYDGIDQIVTSEELIRRVKEEGIRTPMETGMEDLDEIIGGFYEEQVVVITARPKSGKTAFALHLVDMMKDKQPLLLALEQSARELIEQRIENGSPIPHFYTPQETQGIDRTLDWVQLKIMESQFRSGNTKLVVIDHFGYLMVPKSSDQMTWSIIQTMQELKAIAKQTKTAIVVIVHTTKGDPTEPPTTEDLFGSGGYHQEADTVLSLWRETYKLDGKVTQNNNVLLQVLANRRKGTSGAVKLIFRDGTFIPATWISHKEQITSHNRAIDEQFRSYGTGAA